jgi:hypothetical protein
VPASLYQLGAGRRGPARSAGAEVAGGLALSTLTPAVALAGGWALGPALLLWIVPALWSLLSILYVRARLRLVRGQAAPVDDVLDAHGAAVVVLAGLAVAGWLPHLAVAAFLLVSLRVAWGLLRRGVRTSPRRVGWAEVAAGVVLVVGTAIGWRGGL